MNSFEFAINMELEGEKYYKKQAEKNNDNGLKDIFLMLAKDENDHANILQNKSNNLPYELNNSETLSKSNNLFKGIKDFKNEIKQTPDQLDLYRAALEKETESIQLYEKLLSEANDDKSQDLFKFLINQEKDHYTTLNELVSQLNKSNDWVEAAEFGVRPED